MTRDKWTIEKIRNGFKRFQSEYKRLPRALEIDKLDYLPSSRHIQNVFGGLEKLRAALGYTDTHFGKGLFRSEIASKVNVRGRDAEIELQALLQKRFGEVFVHTEKIFDNTKNRVDFYVYCRDGNFGIDIFCADNLKYVQSHVNIKLKKYINFSEELFLVVVNETIKQTELDNYVKSKRLPWSANVKLVTLPLLSQTLLKKAPYPDPLKVI